MKTNFKSITTKTMIASAIASMMVGAAWAEEASTPTAPVDTTISTTDKLIQYAGENDAAATGIGEYFVGINSDGAYVNDKTDIFGKGGLANVYVRADANTLTLTNGTISGMNGTLSTTSDYTKNNGAIVLIGNGKVGVINNVTFSANKFGATKGEGDTLTDNGARGMVRVNTDATLTVKDSTFENNEAAFAGAIDVLHGTINVENTVFSDNKSSYHAGAVRLNGGKANTDSTFTDTLFSNNTANRFGGAMQVQAGATAKFDNVTFSGNKSLDDAETGNLHAGGALYIAEAGSKVSGTAVFENNQALTADGGAVAVVNDGAIEQTGGEYRNNQAAGGGAVAIYGGNASFTDVDFINNQSSGWGGAVMLDSNGTLSFGAEYDDVVIQGNTADASGITATRYNGYTGGFLHIKDVADSNGTVTFDVADGRTMTIGMAGTTAKNVDSITSYGAQSITKTGEGDLVINGSMEAYEGAINVNEGTLTLANGFGTYSIFNQAQINGTSSDLTEQTSSLTVGTAQGTTADIRITGTWNVTSKMNATVNAGSSLSIGDLVVGDAQYVKTNGETITAADPTKKSAADTTVGTMKLTANDDVVINNLTVGGGYGTTKASFTKDGSADLAITGTLSIDKDLGSFSVTGGTLTTAGNNIFTYEDETLGLKDGIAKDSTFTSATLHVTDNIGDYTVANWQTVNALLTSSGKAVVFDNGNLVAENGEMASFADAQTVGNAGQSTVYVADDKITNISAPVTVGAIEFRVPEGSSATTVNVGNDASQNVLTLRGNANGEVITGLDDQTVQLKYVDFGAKDSDFGTISNKIIVEGGKTVNVQAGTFTFAEDVTVNGTLNVTGTAVFDKSVTGSVNTNEGAIAAVGVQKDETKLVRTFDGSLNMANGGVFVAGDASSLDAAKALWEELSSEEGSGQQNSLARTNSNGNTSLVYVTSQYAFTTAPTNVSDVHFDLAKVASTGYTFEDGAILTSPSSLSADTTISGINRAVAGKINATDEHYSINLGSAVANSTVDTGSIFYSTGATSFYLGTNQKPVTSATVDANGYLTLQANDNVVDDYEGLNREQLRSDLNNLSFGELTRAVAFYDYQGAYEQIENAADRLFQTNQGEERARWIRDQYNGLLDRITESSDAASNMAVVGGAFSTAIDINNEVWKALDRRTSLANLNAARNAYGVTPWVDVIGTWNTADSLFGDSGYEADIYGAVIGADWTAPCGAILGLAFNVGQADGNSKDSPVKVENDVDFWGVSLYGSHQIGKFNGKFDLGYLSTSNDLSTHTVLGNFDESLDADIFTIGLGGEFIVNAGSFNVVPHAGIRWSRIDMDDSKFGADYDAMNLFQMPIGVAFSGTFETNSWKLAPMFDIAVVPAFGDKDAVAHYTGGIEETTRVVDTNPIQATLGLNATVDAWTFGVNYGLTAGGDDRLNNSFNLNARFTF